MSDKVVEIKLTSCQAAIVIEALAAKCDQISDDWRLDRWGRESAEKKVTALAKEVTRLKAKKTGRASDEYQK